jgi:hypothetical protein
MDEYREYLARVLHTNLVTLIGRLANEGNPQNIASELLASQVHRLSISDSAIGLGIVAYFTQGIAAIQLILVNLERQELSLALRSQTQHRESQQNH